MSRSNEVGKLIEQKGLSYGEVSLHLGISRSAVAGLYYRYRNPPLVKKERTNWSIDDRWTEARLTKKWVKNRRK